MDQQTRKANKFSRFISLINGPATILSLYFIWAKFAMQLSPIYMFVIVVYAILAVVSTLSVLGFLLSLLKLKKIINTESRKMGLDSVMAIRENLMRVGVFHSIWDFWGYINLGIIFCLNLMLNWTFIPIVLTIALCGYIFSIIYTKTVLKRIEEIKPDLIKLELLRGNKVES